MPDLAGKEVAILWRGRRARAFVPTPLAERELGIGAETISRTARAQADLERAAERMPDEVGPLLRLLLRAEGVASSFIEGVTAPLVDVVLAERDDRGRASAAAWVAANLAAVAEAIESAQHRPLTVEALCRWHRTLMTGSPTPARNVGAFRAEQGWIGGTSPLDAHLVTPPADRLPPLVDDLIAFANRADVDPIAQAAVSHAQFEIIHPFADGNGRIGRVLVAWVLVRRLALVTPPPVSTLIATDVGGYTAGLTRFRLGDHEGWTRWFAQVLSAAGRAQEDLVRALDDLRREWTERLRSPRAGRKRLRSDAAAWQVLDLVPRHLVLTGAQVGALLGVPDKTAHGALRELTEAGILEEYGDHRPGPRGRPRRLYVCTELLGLAGSTPLPR